MSTADAPAPPTSLPSSPTDAAVARLRLDLDCTEGAEDLDVLVAELARLRAVEAEAVRLLDTPLQGDLTPAEVQAAHRPLRDAVRAGR